MYAKPTRRFAGCHGNTEGLFPFRNTTELTQKIIIYRHKSLWTNKLYIYLVLFRVSSSFSEASCGKTLFLPFKKAILF